MHGGAVCPQIGFEQEDGQRQGDGQATAEHSGVHVPDPLAGPFHHLCDGASF